MKIEILGVKIDNLNPTEVLAAADRQLESDFSGYWVTINPEFLVAAQENFEFKKILNQADLAVCDGVGLVLAARLAGYRLIRFPGVDLVARLFQKKSSKMNFFLLGGRPGVTEAVIEKYPEAKIAGVYSGGRATAGGRRLSDNCEAIKKINNSRANILLVGLGQVKQEIWIKENLPKLPKVKLAIGVGGTFDFLSGRTLRAPKRLRAIGLEWLWRLIVQPWRAIRVFRATIKFSWLVLADKLKKSR